MQITRTTELRVLEMMMLEIGNCVTHVRFPSEKGLFPDRFAVSQHPAHSLQRLRHFAKAQFWSETAVTELRVSKPQIILPLRDVIRKLVSQRKPDSIRLSVRTDQINPNQLRLF